MPNFTVKRKEQWIQIVYVENARDEQHARELAREGDCQINSDPQYDSPVASDTWETEEVE